MRELDALLTRFVDDGFDAASGADRAAFQRLLDLPDPQILGLLIGGATSDDPAVCRAVRLVRGERLP
jgi:succinate dehydrogenase flavin-adding protein (antitoxin of CptAB toxin-antitoxin module)